MVDYHCHMEETNIKSFMAHAKQKKAIYGIVILGTHE